MSSSGKHPPSRSLSSVPPARLILTVALAAFGIEFLVMHVLPLWGQFPTWVDALLDATLFVLLLSPALYAFFLRPMRLHIGRQEALEEDLRRTNAALHLEQGKLTGILDAMDDAVFIVSRR